MVNKTFMKLYNSVQYAFFSISSNTPYKKVATSKQPTKKAHFCVKQFMNWY